MLIYWQPGLWLAWQLPFWLEGRRSTERSGYQGCGWWQKKEVSTSSTLSLNWTPTKLFMVKEVRNGRGSKNDPNRFVRFGSHRSQSDAGSAKWVTSRFLHSRHVQGSSFSALCYSGPITPLERRLSFICHADLGQMAIRKKSR